MEDGFFLDPTFSSKRFSPLFEKVGIKQTVTQEIIT